jgi:hypothetical protein
VIQVPQTSISSKGSSSEEEDEDLNPVTITGRLSPALKTELEQKAHDTRAVDQLVIKEVENLSTAGDNVSVMQKLTDSRR